jgi:hypothetical protein
MTFRASNVVPQEAYRIVKQAAVNLKTNLQGINSQLASADADYEFLRNIYRVMERAQTQLSELATTPGLGDYAQAQEGDDTYDVAAEFTTMLASITAARGWMEANVPTNVTVGSPSTWGDGTLVTNVFTQAQTAGLRTALSAVIATIS